NMCLETAPVEALDGLADGIIDPPQGFVAGQPMVWENQIEIDRQSRHIAHEEIDRRAALECEGVGHQDERRDSRQQSGSVEIGSVHGLSTSRPSAERDTQGRSLPLGNCDGSSLLTHGWASSRPSCRQRRTVLTLVQPLSSSPNTLARKL